MPFFEGGFGEVVVSPDGGDDGDGVDLGGADELARVGRDGDSGVGFGGALAGYWVGIRDGGQAASFGVLEIAGYHGAPVPETDDADLNHEFLLKVSSPERRRENAKLPREWAGASSCLKTGKEMAESTEPRRWDGWGTS